MSIYARCDDCKPGTQTTNLLPFKDFESGKMLYLCYAHYKERVKEAVKKVNGIKCY